MNTLKPVKKRALLGPKDLRPYQWRAIHHALRNECCALFIDMGLGKTVSALSIVKAWKHRGELDRPVLVCAPLRVCHVVWRQEAVKWKHTRSLTFSLVHGSRRQRMDALRKPADIYLINPENMVWLLELLRSKNAVDRWPFSTLIVDESTKFKAPGSKRFAKLRHYVHLFPRRMILTGTPRPNHMLELWAQIYIVDCGDRLGTSYERFKNRFFIPDYNGYSYQPRHGAERYVSRIIGDITLAMRASDWRTIPPIVHNNVSVQLPPRARHLYDEFEREMFLTMERGDVEALNAATLTGRCHQIANGAIYTIERNTEQKIWELVHDAKMEALDDILEEASGSPVLVGYYFKHDLERLLQAYPKAPVLGRYKLHKLGALIKQWQTGMHPVMLVHYASAGHGLDGLQHGCHTLALFSLCWSAELYTQLIQRIGGARATRSTIVHHVVARDTVDDAMMLALNHKGAGQLGFINALKQYRRQRDKETRPVRRSRLRDLALLDDRTRTHTRAQRRRPTA